MVKENSKPYKYEVEFSRWHYVSREADENDEWDRGNDGYDNSFVKIAATTKPYSDLVSSLDIKAGESVIVVWYESSSGNSFGHTENAHVEAVGIFRSLEAANELKRHIEEQHEKEDNQLGIFTSDGQVFDDYLDLYDYFGGLETVHIEVTVMK